jgi:hypothetical protein
VGILEYMSTLSNSFTAHLVSIILFYVAAIGLFYRSIHPIPIEWQEKEFFT